MKILVTGFEPFSGHSRNPSAEMIRGLPDSYGEVQIVREVLPVDWSATREKFVEVVRRERPDAVVSFGLSGSYEKLRCEGVGWNVQRGSDNRGVAKDSLITSGGPIGYRTSISSSAVAGWLNEGIVPAEVSRDPGWFLCNFLIYVAGELSKEVPFKFLFVHVPARDDDPQFSSTYKKVSFDGLKRAAELAVEGVATEILGAPRISGPPSYNPGFTITTAEPPREYFSLSRGGGYTALALFDDGVDLPRVPKPSELTGGVKYSVTLFGADKLLNLSVVTRSGETYLNGTSWSPAYIGRVDEYYPGKGIIFGHFPSNVSDLSKFDKSVIRIRSGSAAPEQFDVRFLLTWVPGEGKFKYEDVTGRTWGAIFGSDIGIPD